MNVQVMNLIIISSFAMNDAEELLTILYIEREVDLIRADFWRIRSDECGVRGDTVSNSFINGTRSGIFLCICETKGNNDWAMSR